MSTPVGRPIFIQCRYWEDFALSMRVPNPSPVLDKNPAPMGPEILSSTGAGVWRKAPMAFPDSSSVPDKFQSAKEARKKKTININNFWGVHQIGPPSLGPPRTPVFLCFGHLAAPNRLMLGTAAWNAVHLEIQGKPLTSKKP